MSECFRSVDPTRLVHYEGVTRVPNHQYDFITDMESRMYAKPQEVEEYLKQNNGRPYISCEYMHAMGNSLGGLSLYTDLEDKYEAYQGGFIWDYIDQAIETKNDDGKTVLVYGGDFEDRPSDYGFCTNGVIYADRTYSPKVQEMKALYSNIRMSIQNGMLTVENRNLFADTNNLSFVVRLEKNGVVLKSDTFSLNVPAGESKTMKLTLHKIDSAGEYVYHVSAVTADQTLWADAGHEIAFAQEVFEVKDNQIMIKKLPVDDLIKSIVGEEIGEIIIETLGDINYNIPYTAAFNDDSKGSILLQLKPEPLEIKYTIPTQVQTEGEEAPQITVKVTIEAEEKGQYTYKDKKLTFVIKATQVEVEGEPLENFSVTTFSFDMVKK